MPVKIRLKDAPVEPNTRAITLDEFNIGREKFQEHYLCCNGDYNGEIITVDWIVFEEAVRNFISNSGIPEEDVAVRFVHSYEAPLDADVPTLFYRMQLLAMERTTITDFGRVVCRLIDDNEAWYIIKPNQVEETSEKILIDPMYMNNFAYKAVPTALESQILADGPAEKYVRSITFPWLTEIWAMYHGNGEPSDAKINFASCSFTGLDKGDTGVEWPHGMAMYLTDEHNHDMLDNDQTMVLFYYKGADMGTLCPPKCGSYIVAPVAVIPEVLDLKSERINA